MKWRWRPRLRAAVGIKAHITAAGLRFVRHVAEDGYAAGIPPVEAARKTDLGEFGKLDERGRLVANLHRAYSELRAEPPAAPLLDGIFAEMIEFNSGPIRCLA